MKANKNGVNARLYRWFYMKKDMPNTLCPYFWKLVIMWIFILPVSILCLPMTISNKITGDSDSQKIDEWFPRIIANLLLYGIFYFAIAMVFSISYFVWGIFPEKTFYRSFQLAGFMGWGVSIIAGIALGITYVITKTREKKARRARQYIWDENGDYVLNPEYVEYEPRPNIIIEFIKAKYNKYCPKIDWE